MTISNRGAISLAKRIGLLFRDNPKRSSRRAAPRAKRAPRSYENNQFLHRVWTTLRAEYFPDRPDLDTYTLAWSPRRQKRVLASCNISQRRVVVAKELFEPSACRWIQAVVYHELCHAVIGQGVRTSGGRRQWHGAEFRALEARHPDIAAMNVWIRSGGWAMAVRANRARRSQLASPSIGG
jgi:hypothetical protein